MIPRDSHGAHGQWLVYGLYDDSGPRVGCVQPNPGVRGVTVGIRDSGLVS